MNRPALVLFLFALITIPCQASEEQVVMKTKDFQVTTTDFDYYLSAQGLVGDKRDSALAREGAVEQVFENFYLLRALASDALKNDAIDIAEVDWRTANYRERLLMDQQLTLYIDKEMEGLDWDELALEEFKATSDQYKQPEEIAAAHILISVTDRPEEEAEKLANEVKAKLDAGEDFAEMVEEYSDDTGTKGKGGNLGYFGRNRMVKPFEEAAFAMKDAEVGTISPVIKSRFGFHIIQFKGYKPEGDLTFEQARTRVDRVVEKRVRASKRREVLKRIQDEASARGLEVDLDALGALVQQFAPEEPADTGNTAE